MAKRVLFHLGILGLVGVVAGPARAQTCVGDCDASNTVTISELILLVNIAGGRGTVSECSTIDVNGNGSADIDELVEAVVSSMSVCGTQPTKTFTPTPTVTPTKEVTSTPTPTVSPTTPMGARCGNGTQETGEGCDDGNTLGGDGCAANCTHEDARKADLKNTSISYVQSASLQIKLSLTGQQVLTTGQKRDDTVFDKDGNVLFNPGDIPVVIKVTGNKDDDVFFNPVRVQGLVCACVRQIPVPDLFGPAHCSQTTSTKCSFDTDCPGDEVCVGISAIGKIACGDAGLSDIDYRLSQDHNTIPGDPNNGSSSSPLRRISCRTIPSATIRSPSRAASSPTPAWRGRARPAAKPGTLTTASATARAISRCSRCRTPTTGRARSWSATTRRSACSPTTAIAI